MRDVLYRASDTTTFVERIKSDPMLYKIFLYEKHHVADMLEHLKGRFPLYKWVSTEYLVDQHIWKMYYSHLVDETTEDRHVQLSLEKNDDDTFVTKALYDKGSKRPRFTIKEFNIAPHVTKTDDEMFEILKKRPEFQEIIQEIEATREA